MVNILKNCYKHFLHLSFQLSFILFKRTQIEYYCSLQEQGKSSFTLDLPQSDFIFNVEIEDPAKSSEERQVEFLNKYVHFINTMTQLNVVLNPDFFFFMSTVLK